MNESIDLDAYFARIGYAGPREPTLAALRAIHFAHPAAIPFENLDVLLGRGVRLDLPSLEAKLVRGGRGGYCHEQNGLLAAALRVLGFEVTSLGARVCWGQPDDAPVTPRTHTALMVTTADGPYLADVGFGGLTKTAPLRFEPGVEQDTGHGVFRIRPVGDEHRVEVRLATGWTPMFQFDLTPQTAADIEMSNWFTSTHPEVRHTNFLFAGRVIDGRRWSLVSSQLSIHDGLGPPERRRLDAAEMAEALAGPFGIRLPDDPKLADLLERQAAVD